MAEVLFDASAFRIQFPNQFADPPNTDAVLELYWNAAICYTAPQTSMFFDETCLRQLLNLITAHLLTLGNGTAGGQQSFRMLSASIDKITVQTQGYSVTSQYQWFWNQTPYGMQAYAMKSSASAGGFFLGNGINEQGSYRRAGGRFTPPTQAIAETTDSTPCISPINSPQAPFDFDFGTLDGGNNTASLLIPAVCNLITIEFDGVDPLGSAVTVSLWSGTGVDSGERFSLYYWDGDSRAINSAPVAQALNFDPTGLTLGSGFNLSGIVTGSAAGNPNLLGISGFTNGDSQVLNVDIAVA